ACSCQLRERRRGLTVHHRLHVMEGTVRNAGGIDAPRVVNPVRTGVPASDRHVNTTDERDSIVYHHDLLVMRGTGRKIIIQAITDTSRHSPTKRDAWEGLALERIKHRIVPN